MAQPSVFLQLVQNLLCVVLICLVTYVAFTVLVECEEKRRRRRERRLRQRRLQHNAGRSMSHGSHASRCSNEGRSTKNSFITAPPPSARRNSAENGELKMEVAKPSLSAVEVSRSQSVPYADSKNRRLASHMSSVENESSSEER